MTGWLFDTNVVSEVRTKRGDKAVLEWVAGQDRVLQHLSAVSVMELRYGVEVARHALRAELTAWIDNAVLNWFEARILPVDDATLLAWRRMMEAAKRQGSVSAAPDLLIAAQAHNAGLIVVSRDFRLFVAAGVAVLNPWTQELHANGRTPVKLLSGTLEEALRRLHRTK